MKKIPLIPLIEKCPYSGIYWSVFSRIQTDYGKVLCISPYSVRMRENTDQNKSKYGHFKRSVDSSKLVHLNAKNKTSFIHFTPVASYMQKWALCNKHRLIGRKKLKNSLPFPCRPASRNFLWMFVKENPDRNFGFWMLSKYLMFLYLLAYLIF